MLQRTNGDFGLLAEIMKIETLRLAVFVVRNCQISKGLCFARVGLGIAGLLALGFALRLLGPLLLTRPFLLSLSKSCTRTSCHRYLDYHLLDCIDQAADAMLPKPEHLQLMVPKNLYEAAGSELSAACAARLSGVHECGV